MAGIRMSPERLKELLVAERQFLDLLPDLDKLEQCGEDCSLEREAVRVKVEQISKLKQHFAPEGF